MELASIINESLDALFGFKLRLLAVTAKCLTDGVDAVVQKCAHAPGCSHHPIRVLGV